VNSFTKRIHRLLQRLGANSIFVWILGFALGGLTNVYPKESLLVFLVLTFTYIFKVLWEELQSSRVVAPSSFEQNLRDPHPETIEYARKFEESHFIVGKIIEVVPHPYLLTKAKITDMGWSPDSIVVKETQKKFHTKELLQAIGGEKEFDLPNRTKFSLVNVVGANTDNPTLSLEVHQTDYFTIQTAIEALQKDPHVLEIYGSLVPSENKIPHTLSLHYIVRLSDGSVLVTRREPGIRYYPGTWSFSGEEQLAEFDTKAQHPIESLFKRAFCEEVLPLSDTDSLSENFERAQKIIKSMNVLSIFFEQEICNFSLFGLFQLNIDADDFVEMYTKVMNETFGNRDREGNLFIVSQKNLQELLYSGKCEAHGLFNKKEVTIHESDLHPSSRYRVFRLLRAVNKRPFQEFDFK